MWQYNEIEALQDSSNRIIGLYSISLNSYYKSACFLAFKIITQVTRIIYIRGILFHLNLIKFFLRLHTYNSFYQNT